MMIEILHTSLAYLTMLWMLHNVTTTILTVKVGRIIIGKLSFQLLFLLLVLRTHNSNYSVYRISERYDEGEDKLNKICNWKHNYECNSGWLKGKVWLNTKIEGNYLEDRNNVSYYLSYAWFLSERVCFFVWIHNITYK